jgi:arabinose-5-phosphate isomerase
MGNRGIGYMVVGHKRDPFPIQDPSKAIASATRTIQLETQGLSALEAALRTVLVESFAEAVSLLRSCRGRVIVTGLG